MTPLTGAKPSTHIEQTVRIAIDRAELQGNLSVPAGAHGLVIFAHGSGSSRHSPRNRYVARVLEGHAFGTLLLDLLTVEEEQRESPAGELRFNIDLLAERLTRQFFGCGENAPKRRD
jgi:putative phosphoribosyl transferase